MSAEASRGTRAESKLPSTLAEVAEVAGYEAALALSLAYGGKWMHVPAADYLADHPEHRLVGWIGAQAAEAVARRMAGEVIYVPLARRACARHLAAQGKPIVAIAARLRVNTANVRRYLRD